MLGYIEYDEHFRTTQLARRNVLGGTFLALQLGRGGVLGSLRAARAARQMHSQGVRRAVFPVDFPYTSVFLHHGVLPMDTLPLRRMLCADFVRRRMEQLHLPPTEAVAAVCGEHLTCEMAETVKSLARSCRYVMLSASSGAEALAASLRREYGAALIIRPTSDQLECADILVLFSPRSELSGENRIFCALYPGGEFTRGRLPLDPGSGQTLPSNCDREQLAAALYAMGLRRMDTLLEEISC